MPTIYPFTFTARNFSTSEQTAGLLRPELEKGTITPHDFQAAVDFYPGGHRTYFFKGLAAGGAGFVAYDVLRPVRAKPRNILASIATLAGGGLLGLYFSFRAHLQFVNSLHDRAGFWRALENVNTLVGGPHIRPLGLPTGAERESTQEVGKEDIRWLDFFRISNDPMRSGKIFAARGDHNTVPAPDPSSTET
ncbi:uncharacterized protein STEHIDRAFT_150993 [Stereum hirsutum FP-91666 SS1]|uniref:Uncharacterized protein n=1 Tax=Stereum hirsutum (strain FP-91666) TaxID=721885 RepID=R7RVS6_STEHR|nr:uncharacterized protein STEHIDRAFT_150993 [Stereum hirsutum FP-91666 SS1]EIM79291.1 hypothetical protein STEHIDRAFT_150993 [Stereum hirsutum FP-91666 SS1]